MPLTGTLQRTICLAAFVALAAVARVAVAQDNECAECHEEVVHQSEPHREVACSECHTNVTEEHDDDDLEPLTDAEACGDCHRRDIRTLGRSVHDGEAACGECHGDPHSMHAAADPASAMSRVNQVENCGECHTEPDGLIDGFRTSVHGHGLLKAGLSGSASCVDCHGAHNMKPLTSDQALTSHKNAPEMCGECHGLLVADWVALSAHGMGWDEGNEEVPVCTACHTSHGVAEPGTAEHRLGSTVICGDCHEDYLETYRHSFHGKSNQLGFVAGATCADCHTPHKNLPAENPQSSVHPDNLVALCGTCHEGATASFVAFEPHNDPSDPDDNFKVYVVFVAMTALLLGVFVFFGLHDLLWLQRTLVGALRGEFKGHRDGEGQYIRRFSKANIHLHLAVIVTFLALALTGLPLKFASAPWAQTLINLLGGIEVSTLIHRAAGVGTFAYAIYHLGNLFIRWALRREEGMFWGPNSMVPQPRDVMDVFANFRYFLYLGDRPPQDRWNYIEKFDYLAVFWGVMIIGLSGLMLWFPLAATAVVPGWVLNAAYVVHSDEALLATGFIFFFHFFHTHLRPESFPMDTVIFTGKLSLERFKIERPIEFQRLVDNGELDSYLVDPPTPTERRRAYLWGSVFLAVGLALAVGIVWALLADFLG